MLLGSMYNAACAQSVFHPCEPSRERSPHGAGIRGHMNHSLHLVIVMRNVCCASERVDILHHAHPVHVSFGRTVPEQECYSQGVRLINPDSISTFKQRAVRLTSSPSRRMLRGGISSSVPAAYAVPKVSCNLCERSFAHIVRRPMDNLGFELIVYPVYQSIRDGLHRQPRCRRRKSHL